MPADDSDVGYAAQMGPSRYPDSDRCAMSGVGMTDIARLASRAVSDASEQFLQYGFKKPVACSSYR
ncbi:hypothetical protein [Chromobacterium paludis]|uniref:Uncharacterized protein n=1 Tax=Chromobacterium paludis TaxID=2605945 RepID=A0A5C1DLB3_9NEIS|nr:hypothetical protein [Chromobacterium paludis]QEL57461.1 hypothetical protein FYK34_18730 [Chromobacterium paludis]